MKYSIIQKIINYIKKILHFINIKIIFSFLITLYATILFKEIEYLLFGIFEILLISLITNVISQKNCKIGKIFNIIMNFFYNLQIIILLFSSEFLNRIMITNLTSLEDLSGKAIVYTIVGIILIVICLTPIYKRQINIKNNIITTITLIVIESILVSFLGNDNSPLINYYNLAKSEIEYRELLKKIQMQESNKEEFFQTRIIDYYKKDTKLNDRPNIILIFTEGLSNNIIYDNRNIMPNLRKLKKESISFKNYYNHTFATFRGIIGQLYSGFQLNNEDFNNLISIQSILAEKGYQTTFINTEPYNEMFTKYLESFNFKELISIDKKYKGYLGSMSDKEIYEELFKKAKDLNKNEEPFFLSTYTFGTHISFNSPDKKFKKGKNSLLNRFYNLDYQLGEFLNKYKKSELYDNTIIIFTTDHATYTDNDYINTFKGKYKRVHAGFDSIPLLIYYKNINPQEIDAKGRTSLNLAPTILDFLDISEENYFLGESLFSKKDNNIYDNIFFDGTVTAKVENNKIVALDELDKKTFEKIQSYFKISYERK